MAKISPVSAKYIIHIDISVDGLVDKPDVIGAIFGQTEGLLGSELELRELQRSGRVGRIEVNMTPNRGKASGEITIPSSLDKAETSIIGAAVEIIERIGPCNANIKVKNIEDVRVSKRHDVVERAKALLRNLMDSSIPDSQELSEEVTSSVRVMEIQEYGKDKLPAGPGIDESDEVLVVEGRADVVTLLKYGFKNAIAINGSSVPQTVIDLSKQKIVTVFVDGDRGGDLNIKEMMAVAEVDFVTKAPDGKEVEELMKKEIHKALRGKVAAEQVKLDIQKGGDNKSQSNNQNNKSNDRNNKSNDRNSKSNDRNSRSNDRRSDNKKNYSQGSSNRPQRSKTIDNDTKKHLKEMLDNLVGTRGAYILDNKNNILGKVPTSEIVTTLKNLTSGIQTIVMDGEIDKEIAQAADNAEVEFLVGRNTKLNTKQYKAMILQEKDL